jgi:hypothetical protein
MIWFEINEELYILHGLTFYSKNIFSAQGVPTSYTYSRWEHKSMFGEHIRYLDGFDNGTLLIQNKSTLKSYQNNGVVYVLRTSICVPIWNKYMMWVLLVQDNPVCSS